MKTIKTEKATFGGGCFWHVQYAFSQIKGVVSTAAGYMGGDEKKYPNVSYDLLHSQETGYAEIVLVGFDPRIVSYDSLLKVFWKEHDPTTPNRQGPDVGSAYRSVIFYYSDEQKKRALKSRDEEEKRLDKKIVTQIKKAGKFIRAEEYHQDYFIKTGMRACPANLKKK